MTKSSQSYFRHLKWMGILKRPLVAFGRTVHPHRSLHWPRGRSQLWGRAALCPRAAAPRRSDGGRDDAPISHFHSQALNFLSSPLRFFQPPKTPFFLSLPPFLPPPPLLLCSPQHTASIFIYFNFFFFFVNRFRKYPPAQETRERIISLILPRWIKVIK